MQIVKSGHGRVIMLVIGSGHVLVETHIIRIMEDKVQMEILSVDGKYHVAMVGKQFIENQKSI